MKMLANDFSALQAAQLSQTVWLLGQPSLERYLNFVRDQTVDGQHVKRVDLVNEWREANDYYYKLEQGEAGLADEIGTRSLDTSLRSVVDEIIADQRFQHTFDSLPARFEMVELDKLIVSQLHIDITHGDRLKASIGADAGDEALLRFCQPLDRNDAPFTVRRTGKNRYSFWSDSSDFRFHEAALFGPEQLSGSGSIRPNSGMLGLLVGYSSNFLSVIRSDNRHVLHNGHHRAYALRELGYTHAPCIVQTVTRLDELNIVASHDVVESPSHYFKAARPPLLKDFFDPKIRKLFHLPPIRRVVELSFDIKEYEVAG
jgi:hypothetical protein